jgi:hypothetical protein
VPAKQVWGPSTAKKKKERKKKETNINFKSHTHTHIYKILLLEMFLEVEKFHSQKTNICFANCSTGIHSDLLKVSTGWPCLI